MSKDLRKRHLWTLTVEGGKVFVHKNLKRLRHQRKTFLHVLEVSSQFTHSDGSLGVELTFAPNKDEDNHPKAGLPFKAFNRFESDRCFTGISISNCQEWMNQVNAIIKGLSSDVDADTEVVDEPSRSPNNASSISGSSCEDAQEASMESPCHSATSTTPEMSSVSMSQSHQKKRGAQPEGIYRQNKKQNTGKEDSCSDTNSSVGIQEECEKCRIDGIHPIPIENLSMPVPSRMLRQLDEQFVKHLEQEMEKLPEGNYEMVFAMCTSTISKEEFNISDISTYTFEVIGGAHNTTAAKRLHAKYEQNSHFARRWCRIYIGLNDEQALWLGSTHNQTGTCRHDMTFVDEVEFCRAQLFAESDKDAQVDDPPVPGNQWRERCAVILGKKVHETTSEVAKMVKQLNFTKLTAFNVLAVGSVQAILTASETFKAEGSCHVSSGYIYVKGIPQKDPLCLTSSVSAFAVGHYAVSSKLMKAHISFQLGENQDNIVMGDHDTCYPGSRISCGEKPFDVFTWLIRHFSSDGDMVLAVNTLNGFIASLISGRNCLSVDDSADRLDTTREVISKAVAHFSNDQEDAEINADDDDTTS